MIARVLNSVFITGSLLFSSLVCFGMDETNTANPPVDKEANFALSYDAGYTIDAFINNGIGFGASFESKMGKNFSFVLDLAYEGLPITYNTYSSGPYGVPSYSSHTATINELFIIGNFRYYFGQSLRGFYFSGGAGLFNASLMGVSASGLITPFFLGYKFMSKSGGIFLEPYVGYALLIASSSASAFQFGAKIGFGF